MAACAARNCACGMRTNFSSAASLALLERQLAWWSDADLRRCCNSSIGRSVGLNLVGHVVGNHHDFLGHFGLVIELRETCACSALSSFW